jgi:hypothetical protein
VKKTVTFLIGEKTLTSFWPKEIPAVKVKNSTKEFFFIGDLISCQDKDALTS